MKSGVPCEIQNHGTVDVPCEIQWFGMDEFSSLNRVKSCRGCC